MLLIGRLVLCCLYGLYPLFPLYLIYQKISFFKYRFLFLCQAFNKSIIANKNIRHHLMHIVRIILTYISVSVIRQRHLHW